MSNNFDKLARDYSKTDLKPDKQYSILPTVLGIVGDVQGKTLVDLGCGDGFFTRNLAAKSAVRVIGIDNSAEQIQLAKKHVPENVQFMQSDIFTDDLPTADIFIAPFVLNYPTTTKEVKVFLEKIYLRMNEGGTFVGVIDLPQGSDLRKFGAHKVLLGSADDGVPMEINLYNKNDFICTLKATYYKQETITILLNEVGFSNVAWHKPIVSTEGRKTLGEDFWLGYTENCELGYFTAHKSAHSK